MSSMQDHHSPTRDWTHSPLHGEHRVLTTEPRGKSLKRLFTPLKVLNEPHPFPGIYLHLVEWLIVEWLSNLARYLQTACFNKYSRSGPVKASESCGSMPFSLCPGTVITIAKRALDLWDSQAELGAVRQYLLRSFGAPSRASPKLFLSLLIPLCPKSVEQRQKNQSTKSEMKMERSQQTTQKYKGS